MTSPLNINLGIGENSMDMNNNRWIINRIGLLNFWYYDEEEFNFCEGRLLLRGSNGSGKSVTMQSFIPLLFDGNKSPERLDPFGSRARKLENYLLGEDEKDKDESTAYLFMEFCKHETDNYLTIGMGLRARRGKPLDFWGFSITDGRRMGKDFLLYKDVGEKIPLSKIELKNRIGVGGEVYEGQKDYMAMVNRLLFGFENIEDYDELIKLLIQIRTPKLSKDFKPTVIYEIMNNSLQPLSDDDLRSMSEAIENMDNVKSQLELLKDSKTAADKLKNEYNKYNRFVLLEKARDYAASQEKLDAAGKDLSKLQADRDDYQGKFTAFEQEHENLKLTRESYEHKKQQLEQHDSFKAKQEIEKLQVLLKELTESRSSKEKSLDSKKGKERNLNNELKSYQSKQEELMEAMEKLLEEMEEVALSFYFYEHSFEEAELRKDFSKEYDFKMLRKEIDRYREKIIKAKKALEQEKAQSLVYDRAIEELESARREREDTRRDLDKAENLFIETREEFTEQVYAWEKENELLKLPSEAMVQVSRAVQAFGQSTGYDDIIKEIRKHYQEIENNFRKDMIEIEAVKSEYTKKSKLKKDELNEWKSSKDPEPSREAKAIINRARLDREGIPYIPLYKAIDFRDNVLESVRGKIEEALIDMGLLDSLIVPSIYKDKLMDMEEDMGERYIFPCPQLFKHELSSLLEPVIPESGSISSEDIDNVLKSIMLDNQDGLSYLNENGEYSIGIIKGKTTSKYIPKFIGVEARRRYRLENIQRLEHEIAEINALIALEDQKIHELRSRLVILSEEMDQFPNKKDLDVAYNLVYSARMTLETRVKDCSKKEDYAEKNHKVLKEIRELVHELTAKIEIAVNLEAYMEADTDAGRYRDLLGILETTHVKLLQVYRQAASNQMQIEEILGDIDNILYDMNKLDRSIQEAMSKTKNYEELLKELNYDEIKNEIEECINVLRTIPQNIEDAIRNAQTCKEKCGTIVDKIDKLKEDLEYLVRLNECYKEGFRKEYSLGYVTRYDDDENIIKIAHRIYNDLKGDEKDGKLREDYATSLQEKYHLNRHHFTEYNLRMDYILDKEMMYEDDMLKKAAGSQKRLELFARIQGRDVNFLSLVGFIDESIDENEKLLRESDRQLFEDILANTVGKKIRAKIYHSEQWVKKMNNLMESMNTSSGLSFSLVWKNRTAENEEQIDTRELVEILKSDAALLKEEDMEKLSAHFRSKIAQARKELEDKGASQTFHAVMKDILDYRKWFEFQLFFKKTGDARKELTNNAFDKFSGGEKAMAMYVPLFSAVYARYDGARKDCPRVISLDEAFAGVDEKNIRDMFRLLDELKLNFIINSQILWGDYDTVPSLSVCELIRPNNANFVSVIRYRWNGSVRELLLDDSEDLFYADNEAAAASEEATLSILSGGMA